MVRVDEVVETKYPPGDKVSTDPTGEDNRNTKHILYTTPYRH